jgi:hypothetical protein
MANDSAVLPFNEAQALSEQLHTLGEQCASIWAELSENGYGEPSSIIREAHLELAQKNGDREQLLQYWVEYAKERLAALVGPMDIVGGQIPKVSAYKSPLLTRLRNEAKAGRLKSRGPIVSPQIEPTVKRYVELLPDDPLRLAVAERVRAARRRAVRTLGLEDLPDFADLSAKARYELLLKRYQSSLEPTGFTMDSHRRYGAVFRKITTDQRWAILMVDESREGVEGGRLDTRMAITLPKKAVLPGSIHLSAAATFSPIDLVPGFGATCTFDRTSFAEFCFATDANSFLARSVSSRIEKLLALRA